MTEAAARTIGLHSREHHGLPGTTRSQERGKPGADASSELDGADWAHSLFSVFWPPGP